MCLTPIIVNLTVREAGKMANIPQSNKTLYLNHNCVSEIVRTCGKHSGEKTALKYGGDSHPTPFTYSIYADSPRYVCSSKPQCTGGTAGDKEMWFPVEEPKIVEGERSLQTRLCELLGRQQTAGRCKTRLFMAQRETKRGHALSKYEPGLEKHNLVWPSFDRYVPTGCRFILCKTLWMQSIVKMLTFDPLAILNTRAIPNEKPWPWPTNRWEASASSSFGYCAFHSCFRFVLIRILGYLFRVNGSHQKYCLLICKIAELSCSKQHSWKVLYMQYLKLIFGHFGCFLYQSIVYSL